MIFHEVEKLYSKSSILREACEKRPIRGSDSCYLAFKSTGGSLGSFIEGVPLGGDGSKIRGSRFYLICVDELAQVPDKILDMVLRPMAATSQDPMEKVERLERQTKLIESGLATAEDFDDVANKMVMASSGFYKFNHMWRRMVDYWGRMDETDNKNQYVVHQIPHWFLPDGFQDKNNIEEARRTMSNHEYSMEYEAAMISDSDGFFKASLLELCSVGSGVKLEMRGDKSSHYIVGVDPNQGGSASCGLVIIKSGQVNKVVRVIELKQKTTQQLVTSVQNVCDDYNVIRIFMDKGGGGKALCDLLEEGYGDKEPILDVTNEDNRFKQGRHILEMVNFTPSWIADANFTTLSFLEDSRLLFPEIPIASLNDNDSVMFDSVKRLKAQMLNIVVTQTISGVLHFDTPKKGQNKDLYSAMILASYGIKIIDKELEFDTGPVLYNNGGMVRSIGMDDHWNKIGSANRGNTVNTGVSSLGILKIREK